MLQIIHLITIVYYSVKNIIIEWWILIKNICLVNKVVDKNKIKKLTIFKSIHNRLIIFIMIDIVSNSNDSQFKNVMELYLFYLIGINSVIEEREGRLI